MKCGNSESLDSATVLGAVPLHRGAGFAVDMSARPAFSFRVMLVLAVGNHVYHECHWHSCLPFVLAVGTHVWSMATLRALIPLDLR